MKKIIAVALVVITLFSTAACTSPAAVTPALLKSDKARIVSPDTSQADIAALVGGNNVFAFDLYRILKNDDGNLFYSPYSISLALAMTYGGARGNTEKQMADALKFSLPQDRLHPAFNSVDLALASRGQGAKGTDEKGFRLHIANDVWGQQNFSFLPAYLDLLAQNYGAGLRTIDFTKDPNQARLVINQQVAQETEDKIKDLLPDGSVNELTRMVLTNAIYFNAAWASHFEKAATTSGDFTLLNGNKVSVPMMHQTEGFGYMKGDGYQAVELPYDGRELSMVIMLPDEGQFGAFESQLSSQTFESIVGKIQNKEVQLAMPRFTYRSRFGLGQALTTLGISDAFTPNIADYSAMDGQKDLYIQDVVHQAFVAVDENGTEAAAATGVVVGITSMPSEIIKLDINRPFVFVIRDIGTGTVLFVGRVVNPS